MPVDVVTGDRDLFQLVDDARGIRVIYTGRGMSNLEVLDEAVRHREVSCAARAVRRLRGAARRRLRRAARRRRHRREDRRDPPRRARRPRRHPAPPPRRAPGMTAGMRAKLLAAADYLAVAPTVVEVVRTLDLPVVDAAPAHAGCRSPSQASPPTGTSVVARPGRGGDLGAQPDPAPANRQPQPPATSPQPAAPTQRARAVHARRRSSGHVVTIRSARNAGALGACGALVEQPELPGARARRSRSRRGILPRARRAISSSGGSSRSGLRVDLDSDTVRRARVEHRAGVERRRRPRPPLPRDEPPRDVTEHVDPGWDAAATQSPRHRRGIHPQLRMRRRDHHVELAEQRVVLVERAVVEDVDLDAAQQREPASSPLGRSARRRPRAARAAVPALSPFATAQPRRMIRQREVLVTERPRRRRPSRRWGRAVRPVGVAVQVSAQERPRSADRAGAIPLAQARAR